MDPVLIGCGLAILTIFIWLFWVFLERQFQWAIQEQADWGHTLVIPFISCWFVYLNRHKIFAEPFVLAWTGLGLVILGLGIYSVSGLGPMMLRHHNVMGMGVGMSLFGLVLFFCGWRAMRWLWFPTIYLVVFGQAVSEYFIKYVTYPLQDIAAFGSEYGLWFVGFDVERAGNMLKLFHDGTWVEVNVAEACSGMRMLVAFLALGVAMAYRGLDFPWQRVLLVILAVPTAVFVNILRVMTLGILATRDSGLVSGDFHTMIGLLWLLPAFFIYLGIMWILRHIVVVDRSKSTESDQAIEVRFGPRTKVAFITSVVILVLGGIGFQRAAAALDVHLHKEGVYPRHTLDTIPYTVGTWQSSSIGERKMDASGVEQLGTELYLNRMYTNADDPKGPSIQLHLAYYTDQVDTIPHVPDRCMVAGGLTMEQIRPLNLTLGIDQSSWSLDTDHTLDGQPYRLAPLKEGATVRMPMGEFQLRTTEFSDPRRPEATIFAGYFFIANGRLTPSPGGVKMLAFKAEDTHAYYCKVQVTTMSQGPMTQAEFIELATSFLEPMIPEIMRVLPDWAEVSETPADTSEFNSAEPNPATAY